MPTVTGLKLQKNNKERVNLFLDGEYAFAISLTAAAELRKGQQLTPAQVVDLQSEGESNLAYHQALRYLGMRPRSEHEIVTYLRRKGYADAVIEDITRKLGALGYVNDEAFAQFWVENRNRFRPRSRRALAYELRQKGVDRADIDAALEPQDDEAAAWDAVQPKLERWTTLPQDELQKKLLGFLARRGFSYGVGRAVYERALEQLEDEAE